MPRPTTRTRTVMAGANILARASEKGEDFFEGVEGGVLLGVWTGVCGGWSAVGSGCGLVGEFMVGKLKHGLMH